jgi:ribosome biogenesis protein Tsr3
MGYQEKASELLSIFKWGPSFLSLNREPLEAYALASGEEALVNAEAQYF